MDDGSDGWKQSAPPRQAVEPPEDLSPPPDDEAVTGQAGSLGDVMRSVARILQAEHRNVEDTLQAITAAAVGAVPGAEECSISYVISHRRVEPRAATGDLSRSVDEAQTTLQEGPCLDAVWQHRTVRIDDMCADDRWPRLAAVAVDLGALSSLSFQVFVEGDNMGALNLYARSSHAFDERSEDIGLVFAAHAAVALAGARNEQHLRTALGSRDLIGQAKGILMERYRLTADQAFDALARVSQETNRKLLDIAEELTETGSFSRR